MVGLLRGVVVLLLLGWRGRLVFAQLCLRLVAIAVHAFLEFIDRIAKIARAGGELFGAKHQHHDDKHDQPMPNTETAHDCVPLLKGEPDKFKSRALYWHFPTNMWTRTPSGAIRKGNYKLIENFLTGSIELYDLSQDPSEQISLTFEKPEIAKDLLYDMRAWRKRVGAELPTLNPDFDPFREVEMAKDWWKD